MRREEFPPERVTYADPEAMPYTACRGCLRKSTGEERPPPVARWFIGSHEKTEGRGNRRRGLVYAHCFPDGFRRSLCIKPRSILDEPYVRPARTGEPRCKYCAEKHDTMAEAGLIAWPDDLPRPDATGPVATQPGRQFMASLPLRTLAAAALEAVAAPDGWLAVPGSTVAHFRRPGRLRAACAATLDDAVQAPDGMRRCAPCGRKTGLPS